MVVNYLDGIHLLDDANLFFFFFDNKCVVYLTAKEKKKNKPELQQFYNNSV